MMGGAIALMRRMLMALLLQVEVVGRMRRMRTFGQTVLVDSVRRDWNVGLWTRRCLSAHERATTV